VFSIGLFLLSTLLGCTDDDSSASDSGTPTDSATLPWGQESLNFVTENLVATFEGAWALSGLDASDTAFESMSWTDIAIGSNPRIEDDRALVDVQNDMDGGTWTYSMNFNEGALIEEDGSMGDYFIDMDGAVTFLTETRPGTWTYQEELTSSDLSAMANVTQDNLITGWKQSTKVVSHPDDDERHDISTITHVEYDAGNGTQIVEFTSLAGYHMRLD
jgi:hypothetical protein